MNSTRRGGVGPILTRSPVSDAIIEAIRAGNDSVWVTDRGGYIRVRTPGRCVVTRQAVEERLGRPFELPGGLEAVMPAFKGRFTVTSAEASWAEPGGR